MPNPSDEQAEFLSLWEEAEKTGKPMPPGTREAPFEPAKFGLDHLIENDRKRLNKYATMQDPVPIRPLPKMWIDPDGTVRRAAYSDKEVLALAIERVAEAARQRATNANRSKEAGDEPTRQPPPSYNPPYVRVGGRTYTRPGDPDLPQNVHPAYPPPHRPPLEQPSLWNSLRGLISRGGTTSGGGPSFR
jgi:hypothetical protein